MVIDKIKRMFSSVNRKEEMFGDIYDQGEVLIHKCLMLKIKDEVCFERKGISKKFKIDEIVSLEYREGTLSFIHGHKKYVFIGSGDFCSFEREIKPFTKEVEEAYKKTAKYSRYNISTGLFEEVADKVKVWIVKDKVFVIRIETGKEVIHFEEIKTETQYYMDQVNMTFVWSVLKDGAFHTFSLRFMHNVDFLEFLSKYVGCLYKNVNDDEKGDADAEKYFERMEMENYIHDESENTDDKEDYESCDDDELENHFGEADEKNKHLVIGDEMAFITRGKSVGVFRNTEEGLEFKANIKNVLDNEIEKMITHGKCKELIYLDKNERDRLHMLDVERGEVVETWEMNREVNDYFDSEKLVDTGTLIGVSDYSVFRIDPRTKEKVVESKEYKTKNEFNCGMATGKGHVVVASRKGDLRLYDKIDKRAKSLLPGFGDEIKHVDVTSNGKYIICTCKSYLMLSSVPGDYKTPVGKDKPVPKRLQLKPEHLAYMNEEIDFTPAKFSTDESESSIITSTGSYVIKWNLEDVLNGKPYSYQLAKCNDLIVADNFEFGENNSVIVTMPDDVKKVNVKSLKKPNRSIWR